MELFDTNAWVGEWPFGLLPKRDVSDLQKHWRKHEIGGGLVSDFSGLWVLDPMPSNRALVEATAKRKGVIPTPILNLLSPGWADQLEEILSWSRVRAVRLAPGYGGWGLNARAAKEAATAIEASGRRVVLSARLVDERHEHSAIKVKPVPAKTIGRWINAVPGISPLVQGLSRWEVEELAKLTDRFYTDLSFFEWTDSIGVASESVAPARIVFGSLTPLHVTLAHTNKITQSPAPLARRRAVATTNAKKFLGL